MKRAKITKTSNKKVTQITLPDERFYKIGKEYYPSVTYILQSYPKSIGFYRWLAAHNWDEAERIKEAAGDRGSKVHNAIYDLIDKRTIRYGDFYWNDTNKVDERLTDEEWDYLISFVQWWNDFKPGKVLKVEEVVWSERYKFAGTVDVVLKLKGKIYLVDWKTSSSIYPDHQLQVAAYAEAIGMKIDRVAILRLGSRTKSTYQWKEFKTFKKDFRTFLAVQKIWKSENPKAKPEIKEIPTKLKLTFKKGTK